MALIYMDRISKIDKEIKLNCYTVHKLFFTSCVISAKFIEEPYFNNSYYAKVGGISLSEMNLLESEFLTRINYKLYIEERLFMIYAR